MSNTPFSGFTAINASPWAYPALEALHVLGIALLVGNLVLLELRVWGRGAAVSAPQLARLALPVALAGFALVLVSGLLMFSAAPLQLLANRVFVWKMGLLSLVGCNAVLFHTRGGLVKLDAVARAQALLSVGLWCSIIVCGRWIAYV